MVVYWPSNYWSRARCRSTFSEQSTALPSCADWHGDSSVPSSGSGPPPSPLGRVLDAAALDAGAPETPAGKRPGVPASAADRQPARRYRARGRGVGRRPGTAGCLRLAHRRRPRPHRLTLPRRLGHATRAQRIDQTLAIQVLATAQSGNFGEILLLLFRIAYMTQRSFRCCSRID
jgi:hypothetical protein